MLRHFCILGAGAMGGLYGARLARAGFQVTCVDVWPEHVEAITQTGLTVDDFDGTTTVPVAATRDPSSVSNADMILIFVDSNQTAQAGKTVKTALSPDGFVLTLQNGIGNREALIDVFGEDRVMAGLSYASAAVVGPGHIAHTNAGPTWLGEFDGSRTDRLAQINDAFDQAGLNPIIVDDIGGIIWDKWILNSAINALCAITGLRQGEIPRTDPVERYQDQILDEIFQVVQAQNIRLSDPDLRNTIKAQCWKKYNKPSMLQHMQAGKQTEIDSLNGAAVRMGKELGIPTPFNEALTWLIKGREKGRSLEPSDASVDYKALEAAASQSPRPLPQQ